MVLDEHGGRVTAVAWSPDGSRLLTASADGVARIWNDGDWRTSVALQHVQWNADGQHVLTLSNDQTAHVWAADGSSAPQSFRAIDAAAFSPDGHRLVTTSGSVATLRIWRTADLMHWIGTPSTATLTPVEREKWLLESSETSIRVYQDVERSFGRAGVWPPEDARRTPGARTSPR